MKSKAKLERNIIMSKSSMYYKEQSIREFTRMAKAYETDHAGVYNLCKKDYPDILEELEREPFADLLDAGCGPAPMRLHAIIRKEAATQNKG